MDFKEIKEKAEASMNSKRFYQTILEKNKEKLAASTRQRIKQELAKIIKKQGIVKLKKAVKPEAKYHITYDTLAHGLEPIYFWTLDFMKDKLRLEVNKTEEEFEATAGGGYFGELGAKASVMQDRAISLMERVNAVVRSIINLVYDLKEFEMILEPYDKTDPEKEPDPKIRQAQEYVLRGRWMDQVDIKTGRGSINNLTMGDMQFVTLRDAFFAATDIKSIDNLDLNERVKKILKKKLAEYITWKDLSEKELKNRYNVEKNYLKAQVDALRIFTKWARPYLRAAQKLGMKEFTTAAGLPSPEMVTAFNNMMMELTLFGKAEIDPADTHESYKKYKFPSKYYACVEINFKFRTIPQTVRTQTGTHYIHAGVVDIEFTPYALTEKDIASIEQAEVYEDLELVESFTDFSLKELQEDLDRFLEKKEEIELPQEKKSTFGNPLEPFKGVTKEITNFTKMSKSANNFMIEKVMGDVNKTALNKCFTAYNIFKKAHKMLSW